MSVWFGTENLPPCGGVGSVWAVNFPNFDFYFAPYFARLTTSTITCTSSVTLFRTISTFWYVSIGPPFYPNKDSPLKDLRAGNHHNGGPSNGARIIPKRGTVVVSWESRTPLRCDLSDTPLRGVRVYQAAKES